MSMNVNSTVFEPQSFKSAGADNLKASATVGALKAESTERTGSEDKLSEKATKFLESLRKKYGDYDIFVGNNSDDLKALSKSGNKEFSVIFSSDELEKMADDEKYAAEKMQSIEGAVDMCRKICEQQGYVSSFDALLGDNGAVNKIGVVTDDNGNVKLFAELEKLSEKQRERIEKAREEKASGNDAEEKVDGNKIEDEEQSKYATIEAYSMDELIEKIKNHDWDSVAGGIGSSLNIKL